VNRQSYLDGITLLSVAYTDEAPMKPADADFGVTIDFEKGVSDPVKVFESMAMMLGGLRKIDEVVIGAVDDDLLPTMVLEDVEAASITVKPIQPLKAAPIRWKAISAACAA